MSDERLNSELEQMAGNPKLARAIKDALNKLGKGAGGADLAEMARDVLDGRIDLRTVGQSSAYSHQMTEAIGQFQLQVTAEPGRHHTQLDVVGQTNPTGAACPHHDDVTASHRTGLPQSTSVDRRDLARRLI